MNRWRWWSTGALAASLRLAFLLGLFDAGNDNGRVQTVREVGR